MVHGETKTKTLKQLHVEVKGHKRDTLRYSMYCHMTRSPQGKVYKTGGQTKHEQGRIIVIKKKVLAIHNQNATAWRVKQLTTV